MPIEFSIDKQRGVVFSTASGVVGRADAMDHMDRLGRHPDFRPEFNQLFDFRQITKLAMSSEELREVAGRSVFAADSRRALVVGSGFGFGIGRMYATHREMAGERGIQLFKDVAEARSWLSLSEST